MQAIIQSTISLCQIELKHIDANTLNHLNIYNIKKKHT